MIPSPTLLTNATTADGFLLVLPIVLPVIGILLLFVFGGRYVERIVLFVIPIGLGLAVAVFAAIWRGGRSLVYIVGGWEPPLGIALRADGLSAAMMITVAVVIGATALFARAEFGHTRHPFADCQHGSDDSFPAAPQIRRSGRSARVNFDGIGRTLADNRNCRRRLTLGALSANCRRVIL